jgi:hypothetical protein
VKNDFNVYFSLQHQHQVYLTKNSNKIFIFSVALNDFVDINLNKNALRIDISEEFNEHSVITVPKTLKQMFTIVPSKLRLVTLISFLLKIFNHSVSYLIFNKFRFLFIYKRVKLKQKFFYSWQQMNLFIFIMRY